VLARIDPDTLIAYRYQMRPVMEGLFRAGPALATGAFSIQVLAVGRAVVTIERA
jgi:hypothetical protein